MTRILSEFVSDLRMLARHPNVTIHELPLQSEPYRPPGLWCLTKPSIGLPYLWCFPQPLHPLEAIASLRGFGGLLPRNEPNPSVIGEACKAIGVERQKSWVEYTAALAPYFFVNASTLRIVWHLLTPLNVPELGPNRYGWEEGAMGETGELWAACGFPSKGAHHVAWMPAHLAYLRETNRFKHMRRAFWTEEVNEEVML